MGRFSAGGPTVRPIPAMPAAPSLPPRRPWFAVTLATVTGYVDGYGLLALGTFLSFMSGNTTQTGAALGQWGWSAAAPTLTAVGSFVSGIFCGTLLVHRGGARTAAVLHVAIGAALGAVAVAGAARVLSAEAGIALLSFAMGILNTTLSRVGNEPVNITFVTGTLSRVGRHAALAAAGAPLEDPADGRDTHLRRAIFLSTLWLGFLGGAVLAGVAAPRWREWTLLPPAVLLAALGAAALLAPRRFTGPAAPPGGR